MVPTISILLIAVNALFGIAVPVVLAWYLVRRHHAKLSTILIGAGTFIVFALVLESLLHQLVLKGQHGAAIMGNTLWFALYGGLAAGLFEETGRFLSMKFLMKKEPSTPLPGIAYGAGHGGAEMLIIFGITMVSNLVMAILVNSGQADTLFAKAPAEAATQVQAALEGLKTATASTWLMGLWERFSALILQIGLSILVWVAVRKGGKWLWLFPAAILMHFVVDAAAVLLMDAVSMAALEVIVSALAIAVGAAAMMLAKKL